MKVIGVDLYNQTTSVGVAKSLTSSATDSDHIPCVLIIEDNEVHSIEHHTQDCRVKIAQVSAESATRLDVAAHNDIQTLVFDKAQITSRWNYSRPKCGDPCHPLTSMCGEAIVIIREKDKGEPD